MRHPFVAWFAALALILQFGFSTAPMATGSQAERAAAALSAAIGEQVSLCAEGDHSGAPDHSCPCCDDCALCGLACHAAPLAPRGVAALLAPERVSATRLAASDESSAPPRIPFSAARPRAPPVPV